MPYRLAQPLLSRPDAIARQKLEALAKKGARLSAHRADAAQRAAERQEERREREQRARTARAERKSRRLAGRSTTAWGWGASWNSMLYFFFPINPGIPIACLSIPLAINNSGSPWLWTFWFLAVFWSTILLVLGLALSGRGLRREGRRLAALPFEVVGQVEALGSSAKALMIDFDQCAPEGHLLSNLLSAQNLTAEVSTTRVRTLRVAVPKVFSGPLLSHDNRAYHVWFWRVIRRVLLDVNGVYPVARVRVTVE